MMKTWLVAASVLAVLVAGCSPKLEEGEILEKKGDTFTIRLEKKIDEPIDKVWDGVPTPRGDREVLRAVPAVEAREVRRQHQGHRLPRLGARAGERLHDGAQVGRGDEARSS